MLARVFDCFIFFCCAVAVLNRFPSLAVAEFPLLFLLPSIIVSSVSVSMFVFCLTFLFFSFVTFFVSFLAAHSTIGAKTLWWTTVR